jgi:uncharacterized membrane protein YebE (DUF533 family)
MPLEEQHSRAKVEQEIVVLEKILTYDSSTRMARSSYAYGCVTSLTTGVLAGDWMLNKKPQQGEAAGVGVAVSLGMVALYGYFRRKQSQAKKALNRLGVPVEEYS